MSRFPGCGGLALAVFVGSGSGLAVRFPGVEAVEVSTLGRFGATRRPLWCFEGSCLFL